MKKFVFLITLFFLIGAFFHLEIGGAAIRYGLKRKWGVDFAYKSLRWSEGGLIAEHVVLEHSCGQALIPRVSLHLDWSFLPHHLKGELYIDRPDLSLRSIPAWEGGGGRWVDLAVSIEKGRFEWGGEVQFSLHHKEGESVLLLEWIDSRLSLLKKGEKIEVDLDQFGARLFQSFCPYGTIDEGRLTGRVSFSDGKELLSAHLRVEEFGATFGNGAIKKGEGAFSYNAPLGAKWEVRGVGSALSREFPVLILGKGFFNSHWIDSEIEMDGGVCRISGDEDWKGECVDLRAEHVGFIQAALLPYFPQIKEWSIRSGILSGSGSFSSGGWGIQFEGKDLFLEKGEFSFQSNRMVGNFTHEGGSLIAESSEMDVELAGSWDSWNGEGRVGACHFTFSGGWDGEKCPIQIEKGILNDLEFVGGGSIDPNFDLFFTFKGKWMLGTKEFPLYCPIFSKQGSNWSFDIRCERKTWDLLRIAGTFDGSTLSYSPVSHFLGAPLTFSSVSMGELDLRVRPSHTHILSLAPLLKEWNFDLSLVPILDDADVCFQYQNGKPALFAQGKKFQFHAEQVKEGWNVDLQSELTLHAVIKSDGSAKGQAGWKNGFMAEFDGKIDPTLKSEFSLSNVQFDLALIEDPRFQGKLEGNGHLIYDQEVEADFDLTTHSLKLHSHSLENEGTIHFYYSSMKGALFKGVNLHGPFDCMVDLLEYDRSRSHWIFHGAQVHLPGSFLSGKYVQLLDLERDLNFKAHLDFASDFSTFVCTMPQGIIPFNGADRSIENLSLVWDRGECRAALNYLNHLHRIQFRLDDGIAGRLILGQEEAPLTIDWDYKNGLAIHSVEGSFSGFEASFHEERPNHLIGSARINFSEFSTLLPDEVAKGFNEIKMGKGFEVKGRLKMDHKAPYFEGIVCGKQIELFGFQFRTLLGQLEYSLDRVRLFDTKISDRAGMMKVDEILMESVDHAPWTISIPTITIQELRPSLLQRPGGAPGTISPLVVRELKLTDFHGLLADGNTYEANGALHFINSYKRGETVFDAPANVLSRIVGLDLELLIPVCGDLLFHLADGRFTLTELKNSYSEGNRSEFFLEMNPPPYMDLDWNLEIFIKMKQFVLLKFTESFLISIEGKLQDPEYHLQKRRFFGLL